MQLADAMLHEASELELKEVTQLLDFARGRQSGLHTYQLLTGTPGVGKSRFLE